MALSATVRLALSVPLTEGVKVTLAVQLAPAARLPGQVLLSAKSLKSAPVIVMLVMTRDPVPLLVRVTVCAGLVVPGVWGAKTTVEGKSVTAGADALPVPVRLLVCGL